MTEEILNIIGKLLGAAVVFIISYFAPKVNQFFEEKKIKSLVQSFVEAAEQLYKTEDPSGAIRNTYVKEQLNLLGIAITSKVNAYIESEVYKLGHKKEGSVND